MHEWLLFRLALLFLMFGVLLAVALIAGLRAKHRERRNRLLDSSESGASRHATPLRPPLSGARRIGVA